jgi:hypothetical protein
LALHKVHCVFTEVENYTKSEPATDWGEDQARSVRSRTSKAGRVEEGLSR